MSAKPSPREIHESHQDEVNRLRQLERHDRSVYDHVNARWQRRILPLLANDDPQPHDFPGCTT